MVLTELISRNNQFNDLKDSFLDIENAILSSGDFQSSSVEERLKLLHELAEFPLGRALIQDRGMNGYWTHYVCSHPSKTRSQVATNGGQQEIQPISNLERYLLEERPMALATQERFLNFQRIAQSKIREDIHFASVPSGVMSELLFLDYSSIKNFELTGVDLDAESIKHAEQLARSFNLHEHSQFMLRDAWQLNYQQRLIFYRVVA